ncbi:hypothetical protein SEPCBS57363_003627 [Sporothrix epigloea]|uniref:Uncharacterized protein n=1 Tax=Sporothrix epigloea TaxID=1892477 RepID=A0ABP0DQ98_9PEZI
MTPLTRSAADLANAQSSSADNSETVVAAREYDIGALLHELVRREKLRDERDTARQERQDKQHEDMMRAILSLSVSNRRAESPLPTAPVNDNSGADTPPDPTNTTPPRAEFKAFVDTGKQSDNNGNTCEDLPLQPVSVAFSNDIGPIKPSNKSLRDVQLDFDWYVINGNRENCEKPVDERLGVRVKHHVSLTSDPRTVGGSSLNGDDSDDSDAQE